MTTFDDLVKHVRDECGVEDLGCGPRVRELIRRRLNDEDSKNGWRERQTTNSLEARLEAYRKVLVKLVAVNAMESGPAAYSATYKLAAEAERLLDDTTFCATCHKPIDPGIATSINADGELTHVQASPVCLRAAAIR